MPKQAFTIVGLKELNDALIGLAEEFKPSNAKNVLRGALKDGGEIIARAGKANAPRSPGGGQLAESYSVGIKLTRRQASLHQKESAIEVYVGPTPHPKSVQTEFGNAHQSPQPHLRPAWDNNWRSVFELIVKRTEERLEATRKRLAKKAEREAAKMKQGV